MNNTVVDVKTYTHQYKEQHKQQHKQPLSIENTKAYTVKEYAALNKLHVNTIQAMLKAGEIPNAEKVGRRYRIYVPVDNSVSFEEYQRVKDENTELKALLAGISRMSQWKGRSSD